MSNEIGVSEPPTENLGRGEKSKTCVSPQYDATAGGAGWISRLPGSEVGSSGIDASLTR